MKNKNLPYKDILVERDLPLSMSDGTRLYADVYRPDATGRFPALLIRLPYNKYLAQTNTYAHPRWYARNGYVVIVQDTRGRHTSEGSFYPLKNEARDGYETINWIATLPYCNGKVGMYGFSFCGMNQLLTAALQPANLAATTPAFTGSDIYEDWHYSGGVFSLGFNASWALFLAIDTASKLGNRDLAHRVAAASQEFPQRYWKLPLQDVFHSAEYSKLAPYYYDWLSHPLRDDYWKQNSVQEQYDKIHAPALHLGGWYDTFIEGTLKNFVNLKKMDDGRNEIKKQRMIIGPWYHMPWTPMTGSVDFGQEAANLLDETMLDWFNYWLAGVDSEFMRLPAVKLFTMGENKWHDIEDWPPPQAKLARYYLHSRGRANSVSGNGCLSLQPPQDELADIFVYDPHDPVPSYGGRSCCVPELTPMGPEDQRPVEMRNDVLVFSSDPLEKDIEVTGEIKAEIWASSSARDTAFTLKLVDVYPCGKVVNICDGIIRASLRESLTEPKPLIPEEVYKYEIRVGSTSNLFKEGHRIRVEVSSSNFPLYNRHPNIYTLDELITEEDMRLATQQVYHDSERPSCILLPIVER